MDTMRMNPVRRRRTSLLPLACGCLAALGILSVILLVGGWIWVAWRMHPHAVFSVTFPERSYAGNSQIV